MTTEVKVSVIVPTFNRAHCLGAAIDSILGQDPPPFEILVVDDGSTDDSHKVLSVYSDRVKVLYQANAGVSAARNRGILASSGNWLAFLDSDDVWQGGRMKTLLDDLNSYSNLDPVLHVADIEFSGEGYSRRLFELRGWSSVVECFSDTSVSFERALSGFSLCSSAVRRDVAVAVGGFPSKTNFGEDIFFLAAVATRGPAIFNGACLAEARRIGHGLDSAVDILVDDPIHALSSLENVYGLLKSISLNQLQQKGLGRRRSANLFRLAFVQAKKDLRIFRRSLVSSVVVHPNFLKALARSVPPMLFGVSGFWFKKEKSSFSRLRK